MPLIKLTQEALDRSKLPEIGWSPAKLNNSTESKSSKGNSTNYFFEFICTGGPEKKTINTGRYITIMFNSLALTSVPDVVTKFNMMIAALAGIRPDEVTGDDYETEKWHSKTCWIKIEILPDNTGKLQTQITDFSADAEVPF